jgi:hypothetical protein
VLADLGLDHLEDMPDHSGIMEKMLTEAFARAVGQGSPSHDPGGWRG